MRHRPLTDADVQLMFSRSGGPGGQNVNRRETRVQVAFDIQRSGSLTAEQKSIVLVHPSIKHLVTEAGMLQIAVDTHRSQRANIEAGIERLNLLIHRALAPKKKRRATKPTKGSKERRLEQKKRRSQTKAGRRIRED